MLKKLASKALLVLAGVLLAWAAGEALIRLTPLYRPSFYTYARWRGWQLKPGARGWQRGEGEAFVSINREGFRGPARSVRKPPGTVRVAVLGDSYALGIGVDYPQTFSAVMERRLAGCPALLGRRVEVLDFGVDGYGTAQELLTFTRQASRYEPNAVVLTVTTGNDLRNNSVILEGDKCRPFFVRQDGRLELGGPFIDSAWFRFQCFARFESRHSQLLNRLGDLRSFLRERWRAGRPRPSPRPGAERGLSEDIYKPPQSAAWRDAWSVTEDEITMLSRLAKNDGARFLVATLSNGVQDHPDPKVGSGYVEALGPGADLFYPEQRITALGRRSGFPVLVLAPKMRAYAEAHRVYLHGFNNTQPGTGHWNALGHRVAGRLIADELCRLLDARRQGSGLPAGEPAGKPAIALPASPGR